VLITTLLIDPTSPSIIYHGTFGETEAFITKLAAGGTSQTYSTYLGGLRSDIGYGVTADADGNAFVVGSMNSADFPVANALQPNRVDAGYGSGYDPRPEPEDDGDDAEAFADFMRATKAPSRGAITADVLAGEKLFKQVGCNVCHVQAIATAQTGSIINGGSFIVPAALGNKAIHPFSDFVLHNVGTGDGIPIQPTPEYAATANQIRTAPLWRLRTRNRLMHDDLSFTLQEAIQRHAGQAATVTRSYNGLTTAQKNQLIAFMNSL
jgi:CxxC motif-containing protein (DUF1111 family)